MSLAPIHLDGYGIQRREIHHVPGGALGQLAVVCADPSMAEVVTPEVVGWLARSATGRIGLVVTPGDPETRTLAYRALWRAGWRYEGEHRSLMGGRAWWAP